MANQSRYDQDRYPRHGVAACDSTPPPAKPPKRGETDQPKKKNGGNVHSRHARGGRSAQNRARGGRGGHGKAFRS